MASWQQRSRIAVIAIAVMAILFGVYYYRHRFVRRNTDVVLLLPPGDLNMIYADMGMLRQAGLMGLLAHVQVAPGKEYDDFVHETGFDYTRDLESIVIATRVNDTFLIGRGHFQWGRLKDFAKHHGGVCGGDACIVPATIPRRWVNFLLVQTDVLAVAVSENRDEADDLRPPGRRLQGQIPNAAVWAKMSKAMLTNPVSLPLPLQIFAISIQSAEAVTISADTTNVRLQARFVNAATADTGRRQLEIQTKILRGALGSEKPDRGSVAGLLTEGSFQVVGTDVLGTWPIYPELIRALQ